MVMPYTLIMQIGCPAVLFEKLSPTTHSYFQLHILTMFILQSSLENSGARLVRHPVPISEHLAKIKDQELEVCAVEVVFHDVF